MVEGRQVALVASGAVALGALSFALAMPRIRRAAPGPADERAQQLVETYEHKLIPTPGQLQQLHDDFRQQITQGLVANVSVDGKRMLMLPTYVTRMPDGTETGTCYALDLGGTNFRVMRVHLGASRGVVQATHIEEVSLPKEVYTGPGDKLFDFLATTLKAFIDKHEPQQQQLPPATASPAAAVAAAAPSHPPHQQQEAALPVLGFCFSFAVKQTALDSGILLDWTKGFTCSGVIGNDPVALLSAALARAGRPCRVAALLNDTVGVLAAQRYLDSDTHIGVIIGTGTNACYCEKLGYLAKKWQSPAPAPGAQAHAAETATAINMEWGAFFSPHLPRTPEDEALDAASPHPGKYLFEKLLSGMFLGEAARRILVSISMQLPELLGASTPVTNGATTTPPAAPSLSTPGALTSAALSSIVEDNSWGLRTTHRLLREQLGVAAPSALAARVTRDVCRLVARRSAELVAMALVAILDHTGWLREAAPRRVTVAFDGGVYERFGAYRAMLHDAVRRQLGEHAQRLMPLLRFVLVHDGSCFGAAVLAAAAVHGQD